MLSLVSLNEYFSKGGAKHPAVGLAPKPLHAYIYFYL